MAIDRQRLTEIIEVDGGNNWWKPELFKSKTKPLLPSELNIVSDPPTHDKNYNCFVYAFGLENDPEFLGGKNPVQQEFVKSLISKRILEPIDSIQKGDLVFYENEKGEITHGGLMENKDTVISKWMWGPVIIHKLLDVPASFGSKTIFFISPGVEKIKGQYILYKATGVEIEPIG